MESIRQTRRKRNTHFYAPIETKRDEIKKMYYTAYNTITFLPAVLFNNYLPTKFTRLIKNSNCVGTNSFFQDSTIALLVEYKTKT